MCVSSCSELLQKLLVNDLIFRAGSVGHDILHPAAKNKAKIIDCRRSNGFIVA